MWRTEVQDLLSQISALQKDNKKLLLYQSVCEPAHEDHALETQGKILSHFVMALKARITRCKVFICHHTLNAQVNLSSTFNPPSVLLGQHVRSSGCCRTAPGTLLQLRKLT